MIEGIDISGWSVRGGRLDVDKVVAAGAQFVYLQTTDGVGTVDGGVMSSSSDLRAGGLGDVLGGYHFGRIRHGRPQDTDEQCRQFLEARAKAGLVLPPWFDVELGADKDSPRWNGLATEDEVRAAVELWFETWDRLAGGLCCFYSSPGEMSVMGTDQLTSLVSRPLALAEYTNGAPRVPAPYTDCLFHQYRGTSPYPGVPNGADRVRFNGTLEQLTQT